MLRSWTSPPSDSDASDGETIGSDCGSDAGSQYAVRAMKSEGDLQTPCQGAKNEGESTLQELASRKMKRHSRPGSSREIVSL